MMMIVDEGLTHHLKSQDHTFSGMMFDVRCREVFYDLTIEPPEHHAPLLRLAINPRNDL